MNYFYPPKDDHLNHDWVAEFFSVIVGFSTSTISVIFLGVTFLIIGLIISLVIFAKRGKRLRFNPLEKGEFSARKQVEISPLDLGENPRDSTKQLILQNKA